MRSALDCIPDDRAQHLLRSLVERYIRDGQPVGSRTLARDSGLKVSPATVRNVMADLEDMGFLSAPHTSAGRIPTPRGLRFFVDSLLSVKPLHSEEVDAIRSQLGPGHDTKDLVATASNMLSKITRLAGVVTVPRREHVAVRQLEFLPLSSNRVLAILVVNESEVQNRILEVEHPYTAAELERASNYLNAQLAGKDLAAVREKLLAEMRAAREGANQLMLDAIGLAERVLAPDKEEDYVLAGQTNLMDQDNLSDVGKLRQLFEVFQEKHQILHLLDNCLDAQGVQIFIGEESGNEVLEECSLVTAPYKVDGEVVGVLGVIGPTRMAYGRVIPIVDVTARLLGAALKAHA